MPGLGPGIHEFGASGKKLVDPRAKLVTGFEPLMPTFRGLVGEGGLYHLIEYIKTLSEPKDAGSAGDRVKTDGKGAERS